MLYLQLASIHHNHKARLKATNAITTAKFKTNKGQRSMLFLAAKLFNTYMTLGAWILRV